MLINCQLGRAAEIAGRIWVARMGENRKSAYRASASGDDAVKGQGIGDPIGHASRASRGLGLDGDLANGLGLLVPKDRCPSGVDMRGTTICERVDHVDL